MENVIASSENTLEAQQMIKNRINIGPKISTNFYTHKRNGNFCQYLKIVYEHLWAHTCRNKLIEIIQIYDIHQDK